MAFLPATSAMEYTAQLPAVIDRKKWRFHGETARSLANIAQSAEISERCIKRTAQPRGECRELLADLNETPLFYVALRKHLTVRDTEFVLRVLREHSGWGDTKNTKNERLRKEYLKLFDECRHFDPDWVDTEMQRRQKENQLVPTSESSTSKRPEPDPVEL